MEKLIPYYLLLLLLIVGNSLVSQEQFSKYGEVNKSSFDIKEEGENGVVVFDNGISTFIDYNGWYTLQFKRHKRVKILTEAGLAQASIEIPLYRYNKEKEIVSEIRASSYIIENGEKVITEFDKSYLYEEVVNDYWTVQKFVIPNAQIGSIIEYEYEVISPFFFNLPDWVFQSNIPTLYSSYTIGMIPFYDYVMIHSGENVKLKQDHYLSKGPDRNFKLYNFRDDIFSFVNTDLPAFNDESFISSKKDYISKIDFQMSKFNSPDGSIKEIISTWEHLTKDLKKDEGFGYYIEKAEKEAKKIFEANPDLLEGSSLVKATNLINYIKKNINPNDVSSCLGKTKPSDVLKSGKGRAAEINLILIALLRQAGIEAHPIILSTRENGKIYADYPLLDYFNKTAVIVTIGEAGFLTDASSQYAPINLLPVKCLNENGLIIGDGVNWVPLLKEVESLNKTIISQKMNRVGDSLNATLVKVFTGYNGEVYRTKYSSGQINTLKTQYLSNPFTNLTRAEIKNFDKLESPLTTIVSGEVLPSILGNEIIIVPFLNQAPTENPFKAKERSYPIDFNFVETYEFNSKISIPNNYKIEFVPKDITDKNDVYELTYTVETKGDEIAINARYVFFKNIYKSSDYHSIKSSFDKIISTLNQEILLKRL